MPVVERSGIPSHRKGGLLIAVPENKRVSFTPHQFQTKARLFDDFGQTPNVLLNPAVLVDVSLIAELSGHSEIGFLGTVEEMPEKRFLIDSVHLIPQKVDYGTTEMTEDGLSEYFTELVQTDFEACQRMHFWGHVHPGNSTSPSFQDNSQMRLFTHNHWFIRGIFSRQGRIEFTFFDFQNKLVWEDIPWTIFFNNENDERQEFWRAQIGKYIQEIPEKTPVAPAHPYLGLLPGSQTFHHHLQELAGVDFFPSSFPSANVNPDSHSFDCFDDSLGD